MLLLWATISSLVFSGFSAQASAKEIIIYKDKGLKGALTPFVSLNSFIIDGWGSRSEPRLGFGFGTLYALTETPVIFETGISYVSAGTILKRKNLDVPGDQSEGHMALHYVGIPFSAKYFSSSSRNGFYFKTALTPMYLISAESKTNYRSSFGLARENQDLKGSISPFDLMMSAGVGTIIRTATADDLVLDVTFNRGFFPVNRGNSKKAYNTGLTFMAGFLFF